MFHGGTAANLILSTLGGPAGLTAYVRTLGDEVTRLDRDEPMLNEARPGDPRDTTSPDALLRDLQVLLLEDALAKTSRERLTAWMVACSTGRQRLRAGVPEAWRTGDKTGSGNNGTYNDVAVIWPPQRKPILIAAYLTETTAGQEGCNAVFADIARIATAG